MVEGFTSGWELQPQEMKTPGEEGEEGLFQFAGMDPCAPMIDAVNKQFEFAAKPIVEHLERFRKFRLELSKKILEIGKEVEIVKEMFREAEANKVGDYVVF